MTEIDAPGALLSTAAFNAAMVVAMLGLFWLGVFVLRWFGVKVGYSISALGFIRPDPSLMKGIGLGFLVGLAALIASAPLNALMVLVLQSLGYSTESTVQQPFMQGLQGWVRSDPALAVPLIVGVVVILGPAVEELVFRGGLFNGLRAIGRLLTSRLKLSESDGKSGFEMLDRVWFVLAAVLSSVFFSFIHLEPIILPAIALLAFGLCWLFERTGSLLPCFVAHAVFNSFATAIIILSGLGVLDLPV